MGRKTITIPDDVLDEFNKTNTKHVAINLSDLCTKAIKKYIEDVKMIDKLKLVDKKE